MKIEEHVFLALDAWERNETDHALMHACMAVDGTAKKIAANNNTANNNTANNNTANNNTAKISTPQKYKSCLRENYWIIEAMMGGGVNLTETKWLNLKIDNGHGKIIAEPDLADFIYHIFRCNLRMPKKYQKITNYYLQMANHHSG